MFFLLYRVNLARWAGIPRSVKIATLKKTLLAHVPDLRFITSRHRRLRKGALYPTMSFCNSIWCLQTLPSPLVQIRALHLQGVRTNAICPGVPCALHPNLGVSAVAGGAGGLVIESHPPGSHATPRASETPKNMCFIFFCGGNPRLIEMNVFINISFVICFRRCQSGKKKGRNWFHPIALYLRNHHRTWRLQILEAPPYGLGIGFRLPYLPKRYPSLCRGWRRCN